MGRACVIDPCGMLSVLIRRMAARRGGSERPVDNGKCVGMVVCWLWLSYIGFEVETGRAQQRADAHCRFMPAAGSKLRFQNGLFCTDLRGRCMALTVRVDPYVHPARTRDPRIDQTGGSA